MMDTLDCSWHTGPTNWPFNPRGTASVSSVWILHKRWQVESAVSWRQWRQQWRRWFETEWILQGKRERLLLLTSCSARKARNKAPTFTKLWRCRLPRYLLPACILSVLESWSVNRFLLIVKLCEWLTVGNLRETIQQDSVIVTFQQMYLNTNSNSYFQIEVP